MEKTTTMLQKEALTERFYTSEQVAELLGVSQSTLQRYRNEKKIAFTQIDRKIIYKHSDILRFLDRYRVHPVEGDGL